MNNGSTSVKCAQKPSSNLFWLWGIRPNAKLHHNKVKIMDQPEQNFVTVKFAHELGNCFTFNLH